MRTIDRKDHRILGIVMMAAFALAIWEISGHLIATDLFPRPYLVFEALVAIMGSTTFVDTILISTARVLASISIVFLVGTALILLSLYLDAFDAFTFKMLFPILYAVPGMVFIFVILILLGISPIAPVVILSIMISPYFFINMQEGFSKLDYSLIAVGEAFGNNEIAIMRHTVLPQLYPQAFSSFRSMVTSGYGILTVAEVFTATSGIGARINDAYLTFDINTVAAWGIVVMVLLLLIDTTLRRIDRTYLRRHRLDE